ncbi:hypothetical protein ACFQXB_10100 [Plastorhodobacter daqingensis]|uniref:Uncharacterized protein n=1 Tax=Plastorhodobacter daqingensis TaxID=1387281 RepID=A0ABW2ULX4_9RHOB
MAVLGGAAPWLRGQDRGLIVVLGTLDCLWHVQPGWHWELLWTGCFPLISRSPLPRHPRSGSPGPKGCCRSIPPCCRAGGSASSSRWYVTADPGKIDALEFACLSGPQVENRSGWDVDGVEIRVILDFRAGFIDHRRWFMNAARDGRSRPAHRLGGTP